VTPHQWLLRARLRDAGAANQREPRTDHRTSRSTSASRTSPLIRSFHAEFGMSPRRWRLAA